MSKRYDIVAITGEYTNAQGETKKRYKNVGVVLTNDNGPYIVLDKTFNPAGLAEPGREGVILSLFEPKEKQQAPAAQAAPASPDFSDDIPFANPYKNSEYIV